MVSVLTRVGMNGADLADCANSDVFASFFPSIPALQAKRCFRALTVYCDARKTPVAAGAAVGGDGGHGSAVVVSSDANTNRGLRFMDTQLTTSSAETFLDLAPITVRSWS